MKKLAYISLVAACIFGVQPQKAFSATESAIEAEVVAGSNVNVRVQFSEATQTLNIKTSNNGKKEKVLVYVSSRKDGVVAKEMFVLHPKTGGLCAVDLSHLTSGVYDVKISSPSILYGTRFKKK